MIDEHLPVVVCTRALSAVRRIWNSSFPGLPLSAGGQAAALQLGLARGRAAAGRPQHPLSSELLQDGGGASTEAFPLKYETKLGYLSDSDFKQWLSPPQLGVRH